MTLKERLSARLTDIATTKARIQSDADVRIAALEKEEAALTQAGRLVSAEIEQAFALLKSLGIDL